MKHGLRRFAAVGCAVAIAAAISLPLTGGTAGAASHAPRFNKTQAIAFIRSSLRDVKIGDPIRGLHVVDAATSGGIKAEAVTSGNWSGYADLGATYTAVKGEWKEPKITCPTNVSGTSLAAFWVGIDGFNDQTVEQDGTIAECDGSTLVGQYDWWEMYPTNTVQIENAVSSGNEIIAQVNLKGSTYTLKVTDKTSSGATFSTGQTCGSTACADASAEWIAEAPCCSGSSVYPLAKFAPWRVVDARATSGGRNATISKFSNDSISMLGSSGDTLASPGPLNSTGGSFTDTWSATS